MFSVRKVLIVTRMWCLIRSHTIQYMNFIRELSSQNKLENLFFIETTTKKVFQIYEYIYREKMGGNKNDTNKQRISSMQELVTGHQKMNRNR